MKDHGYGYSDFDVIQFGEEVVVTIYDWPLAQKPTLKNYSLFEPSTN